MGGEKIKNVDILIDPLWGWSRWILKDFLLFRVNSGDAPRRFNAIFFLLDFPLFAIYVCTGLD